MCQTKARFCAAGGGGGRKRIKAALGESQVLENLAATVVHHVRSMASAPQSGPQSLKALYNRNPEARS